MSQCDRYPIADSSLAAHKLGAIRFGLCASPDYLAIHSTLSSPQHLSQQDCPIIMSESLSQIIPWTMKRGKELAEVKPKNYLPCNDFLFVK